MSDFCKVGLNLIGAWSNDEHSSLQKLKESRAKDSVSKDTLTEVKVSRTEVTLPRCNT